MSRIEPILSESIKSEIEIAILQFRQKDKLEKWGFNRPKGSAILLEGPPGTGKTVTAKWIAQRLQFKFQPITAADFGSHIPGQNERNIKAIFARAANAAGNGTVLFLDEADGLLLDRRRLTGEQTYRISIINTLLQCIEEYSYLTILASNHADFLDSALERRLLARIKYTLPDFECRKKLWQQKTPSQFIKLTDSDLSHLADTEMTGNDIEKAVCKFAKVCILTKTTPSAKELIEYVSKL